MLFVSVYVIVLLFKECQIVSLIAPIAGEILFIFSLKMKRLYRKAGIAITENARRFASKNHYYVIA